MYSGDIIEHQFPNLTKLQPHPAVAFGLGSRPSAAALMGGMLPVCQIPQCDHRKLREIWNSPWFLTLTHHITEKQYYLCTNGWIIEILLPWMDKEQRSHNLRWHDNPKSCPSQDIVDYFLFDSDEYDSYFAYLHFFESHWPFYSPEGEGDRIRSIQFVDDLVGKVVDARPDAEIVVVSDHNVPPRGVSAAEDVPSPKTMLSFIACNDQSLKGKPWGELVPNISEVVRRRWDYVQK